MTNDEYGLDQSTSGANENEHAAPGEELWSQTPPAPSACSKMAKR
jgi:hypothetical protein